MITVLPNQCHLIRLFLKLEVSKIALLNVNSLTKHIYELNVFLANKPLDVLAINESKLDLVDSDRIVNLVHPLLKKILDRRL